jgi:hypothetical protein
VTIYAWRKRFGVLKAVDVKRQRQLELEIGGGARSRYRDSEGSCRKKCMVRPVFASGFVSECGASVCPNVSGLLVEPSPPIMIQPRSTSRQSLSSPPRLHKKSLWLAPMRPVQLSSFINAHFSSHSSRNGRGRGDGTGAATVGSTLRARNWHQDYRWRTTHST